MKITTLITLGLTCLTVAVFAQNQDANPYGHRYYNDHNDYRMYGTNVLPRTDHANLDTLTSVIKGDLRYDTINAVMVYYDGSTWVNVISGGGNTLDEAYDSGGAGAGRTITADAGAVEILGEGATQLLNVKDTVDGVSSSWLQMFGNGAIRTGYYADLTGFSLGDGTTYPYITPPSGSFVTGVNNDVTDSSDPLKVGNFASGLNNIVDYSTGSFIAGGQSVTIDSSSYSFAVGSNSIYVNGGSYNGAIGTKFASIDTADYVVILSGFLDTISGSNVSNIISKFANVDIHSNGIAAGATINSIEIGNNSRITNNAITSSSVLLTSGIQYCNLWDNCEIIGNELSGDDSFIWDVHALENCAVDSNQLTGDNTYLDILVLSNFDNVSSNVLSGNDSYIRDVFSFANSNVRENTLTGASGMRRLNLSNATISNNTLSSDVFSDITINNGSITGGVNQSVQNVAIFNRDIDLSTIIGDVDGFFAFGGDVDVNGGLKYVDGTQADGYVLTSDASGNASWIDPSTLDFSTVPAYTDNTAAEAVLGAGKLYYTDVAGEYMLKVTH